jgi:predicted acyltransferase
MTDARCYPNRVAALRPTSRPVPPPALAARFSSRELETSRIKPMDRPSRIPAIDILRGVTIAFMVMVNNPGSYSHIYAGLRHAEWHGFTPVDFIFPFFLFIAGVSINLSLARRRQGAASDREIMLRALRRGAILFFLGILDNGFPYFELETLRIPGVLQRIGIVTFLATTCALKLRPKTIATLIPGLLLAYWALMTMVPIPEIGDPDLSTMTDNLAAWIDRKLLGGHLWVHEDQWDPEGILSTIPALCLTLTGLLAGRRLAALDRLGAKISSFMGFGTAMAVSGLVWSLWFPINRWLWTSSFMLFVSGLALYMLALCLWACQFPGAARALRPFAVFGSNAIVMYLGSSLLAKALFLLRLPGGENYHDGLYRLFFSSWLPPFAASAVWAACFALFMFLPAYVLHARKIYIKI